MGRLVLFVIALASAGLAPAVDDGPPPRPATVESLVEQLGSPDFAARERASEALLARGPAVLPALRKAVKHPNPEVARRAGLAVRVLEARAALEPKRVTLKPGPWTLADAAGAIRAQTGYPLTATPRANAPRRTFGFTDLPFWAAVDRVAREFDQGLAFPAFEKGVGFAADRPPAPFAAVDGPFRVELTRAHEDRDVDFTGRGSGRELGRRDHQHTLTLHVLAEPRFGLLNAGPVQVETAVDDRGEKLIPLPAEGTRDPEIINLKEVVRRDHELTLSPRLRRSAGRAAAVRTLRGTVPVSVVVERRRVVVTEDVLGSNGARFQVGSDAVQVRRAELDQNGGFSLSLGVPGGPDEEWKRWWHKRVSVEDGKGTPMKANARGWGTTGNEHHISLDYPAPNNPGAPPPARLVVEDWVVAPAAVRFAFADVPFP